MHLAKNLLAHPVLRTKATAFVVVPTALASKNKGLNKARRRRGKKPAPGKENVAPKDVAAGPVDVAAVLKARAAAKKVRGIETNV